MAHAYTPGLTVTKAATLHRDRRLPILGRGDRQEGAGRQATDIVARTSSRERADRERRQHPRPPARGPRAVARQARGRGHPEGRGPRLNKTFFGLFTSRVAAPVTGTVETVSKVTGNVILREPPIPLQVQAYVDGVVVDVIERQGVVIETKGAFIQGIFGIGGETHGTLTLAVKGPAAEFDQAALAALGPKARGAILIGGAHVTKETLAASVKAGVAGIVVGGFRIRTSASSSDTISASRSRVTRRSASPSW